MSHQPSAPGKINDASFHFVISLSPLWLLGFFGSCLSPDVQIEVCAFEKVQKAVKKRLAAIEAPLQAASCW
jgi:hypothetical protein